MPPRGKARFSPVSGSSPSRADAAAKATSAPNGSKLIFQSEREAGNPFYQIYTLDFETGDSARVSPGHGKTTCAFFHPSGGRVLFGSTHHDPQARAKQKAELDFRASGKQRRYSWDYDETMDIFTANPNGTDLRQLTTALGYDAEAGFSPDGSRIVFSSTRSAYADNLPDEEKKLREIDLSYFGEIYIMNADGSGQTRLTRTPGYDGGPFFLAGRLEDCLATLQQVRYGGGNSHDETRRFRHPQSNQLRFNVVGTIFSSVR